MVIRRQFSEKKAGGQIPETTLQSYGVGRSMSQCSFSKTAGGGSKIQDFDSMVRTTFNNSAIELGEKVSN